jgi:hypothetical protein
MKLYLVWGFEYHVGQTLFGIYDNYESANLRLKEVEGEVYDEYKIVECNLNESMNVL